MQSSIHCESNTDQQEENVTWHFGDANEEIQILNISDVLFSSNQPRINTLTLTPTDVIHGMDMYCCYNISWKRQICSVNYNIFIKGIYLINYSPVGARGFKSRMYPPYPHVCRKRRLKWGAVI